MGPASSRQFAGSGMFSAAKRHKGTLLSFRHVAGYFVLFVVSALLLFGLSVYLLDASISEIERERVTDKTDAYLELFQNNGVAGLAAELSRQHAANSQSDTYVHLMDESGTTIWLTTPAQLGQLPSLHFTITGVVGQWEIVDLPTVNDLDVYTRRLSGGYVLQTGRTTQRQEFLVESVRGMMLLVLGGIVLLGVGGGFVFAVQVRRPVEKLAGTVKEVASGDMSSRVPAPESDGELGELADLFNGMLERIETLIRTTRSTLDNVAHDLRTPLARMKTKVERAILENAPAEEQREILMDCAEEIERINDLVTMLMDVAEAETGQMRLDKQKISAVDLLHEVEELYELVAEERNVAFSIESDDVRLFVDRQRMTQALGNLIDNALKHSPENGTVTLGAAIHGGEAVLTVEDNGPGIPQEERERIFDKLYRLDKSRSTKGLGLGLSLVRAVVSAHGGRVAASEASDGGSVFSIRFPMK